MNPIQLKEIQNTIPRLRDENSMLEACVKGDLKRMQDLFDKKVSLNILTRGPELSLMHIAVYNGHKEVVLWLLENNAHFDLTEKQSGRTPFHLACEKDNKPIIRALWVKGAQINKIASLGCNALHFACGKNPLLALRLTVAGVDPKVVNSEGFLPKDYLKEDSFRSFQVTSVPAPFPREIWVKIMRIILLEDPEKHLFSCAIESCKALYDISINILKVKLLNP